VTVERDYYEILGVSRDADGAELKRAYRRLAMEHHPDRNPGNKDAEARFKEASEAYQVLSDGDKRARYDRFGHAGLNGGGGAGFSDLGDIFGAFSDIFGDMFGGGGRGPGRGQPRGSDIETRVNLTLLEAARGAAKEVIVHRHVACATCKGSGAAPGSQPETCQQCGGRGQVLHAQGFLRIATTCPVCRGQGKVIRRPCPTCEGAGVERQTETLQVNIPAGVEDGSTLRLVGRGEAAPGGRPGNLYVVISVEADPRFERDGVDLHTEVAVSFPQATLGDRIAVPVLGTNDEGDEDSEPVEEVDLAPGTQPGDTVILRGHGLPRLDGRGTGDLIAHVKVVVPTSLSPEQETHLRAYAAAGGQRVNPEKMEKPGFFNRKKKKK
jgi:molecular chaperone DnaJ